MERDAARLADEMGITDENIRARLSFVSFEEEDVARVRRVGAAVAGHEDALVATFFGKLATFPEAAGVTGDPGLLGQARALKREHLLAMTTGGYGRSYVEERLGLGILYASGRLAQCVFLGAFHTLMRSVGELVMNAGGGSAAENFADFMAFKKVAFFDLSLIADVLVFERERTIRMQQEAIRELSTPALALRPGLVVLPIVGLVDDARARQLTQALLSAIRTHRARAAILDVTGIPVVDSNVAHHLTQAVSAARLMGTTTIVSGISADVAHSLVTLGIDLARFQTVGDLQSAIEAADHLLVSG